MIRKPIRHCSICGDNIMNRKRNALFCKTCARIRSDEYHKEYQKTYKPKHI